MNINVLSATTAVALAITAVPALAATITFDSFNDAEQQLAVDDPLVEGLSPTSTRDISINGTDATRTLIADSFEDEPLGTQMLVKDGALSFSNIARAQGAGTLSYDFTGTYDLLAGLGVNPYFEFEIGEFDGQALFAASIIDSDGTRFSYNENLDASIPFEDRLFFSQFTGEGSLNFNEVASLTFMISSRGDDAVDGSIDSINLGDVAPIPLPASGLLLLAGMGGMTLLRRRRKA